MAEVNGTSKLLGTNKLQEEVDAFSRALHEATETLTAAMADVKTQRSQSSRGGGSGGNGFINAAIGYAGGRWGSGSHNGGGATFGGAGASTPTTTGGTGNGGNGTTFGPVASAAAGGMAGLANKMLGPSDMAMTKTQVNTAVQLMQRTASGGMTNTDMIRMMGRQAGFSSWGDAAGFAQTMQYSVGMNAGSSQWKRALGGVSAMSTLDPTVNGARMGNFNQYMNSFGAQTTMARMGYSTRTGSGGSVSPQQLADQLLKDPRIGGISKVRTGADVDLILSDRGNLGASLNNMVANGLDPDSANLVRSMLRSKLVARLNGVSDKQFNQTFDQMSNPNASSKQRNSLARSLGLNPTDSTVLEQGAASSRDAEAGTFQGFSDGLRGSTAELEKFNANLKALNDGPLGHFLGAAEATGSVLGGAGGTIKKWLGGLVPSGLVSEASHLFGGQTGIGGGAVGSSWQNSGGGQSGQPVSSAKGTVATGQGMSGVAAVNNALSEIGVAYSYGGGGSAGPSRGSQQGTNTVGFDCSGLMQFAFGKIGIKLPRTADQQQKVGVEIPLDKVQPGDLVFIGNPAHHVAMISRPGMIIEAPHTGATVRERPYNPREWTNARRVVGSVGDTAAIRSQATQNVSNGTTAGGPSLVGGLENMLASEWDRLQAALSGGAGGGNAMSSGAGRPTQASTSNAGGNQQPAAVGGTLGQWINSALGILNMDPKRWGQDVAVMAQHESGGNPRAVNNWDSNAKAGRPSKGVLQVIDPTFRQYMLPGHGDIFNPIDNIIAGVRYAIADYGNLDNVPGVKSLRNGGAYKGYAVGSWNIDVDQTAKVHAGEMIIPAAQAQAVRDVLSGNNPVKPLGTQSGVTIQFAENSIVISGANLSSTADARAFGKTIVDAITSDNRIQNIRAGAIH